VNYFITSDGSRIAYETKGSGTPVLFIHGWSVEYHLWHNKIEAIRGSWKRKYRRIYFDLPGMGKSVGAKSIKNSDDMLRNIEEFLEFMIGNKPYILAGESYGGYLARGLLARQAARIDGLFLLCSIIVPGDRKGKVPERVVIESDQKFLATLPERDRAEFAYLSVIQNKKMHKDYKKDIRLERLPENAGFLEGQLDGAFAVDPNQVEVKFDKPVLLLLGRQDSEVGFEQQYDLYKAYSRATIMIVDKAGHNLQIENRELFRQSFLDFLRRIEDERKAPSPHRKPAPTPGT